jgi:hypothetical protein
MLRKPAVVEVSLKKLLSFASLAALLGAVGAPAQEKTAIPELRLETVSYTVRQSYSANDIKVMGTLNSGETSAPVEYTAPGPYRAFVFEGNGHDRVDITVTGADGKAYVALADSALKPIASGIGHLSTTLPYHGPDIEAFYILLKPTSNRPARLAVHFTKTPAPVQPASVKR